MYIHNCIYIYIYIYTYQCISIAHKGWPHRPARRPSLNVSLYLSVSRSLSLCLSLYLSVSRSLSLCLSLYLSVSLSLSLSHSVSLSLSLSLSLYLSVSLCLSLSLSVLDSSSLSPSREVSLCVSVGTSGVYLAVVSLFRASRDSIYRMRLPKLELLASLLDLNAYETAQHLLVHLTGSLRVLPSANGRVQASLVRFIRYIKETPRLSLVSLSLSVVSPRRLA